MIFAEESSENGLNVAIVKVWMGVEFVGLEGGGYGDVFGLELLEYAVVLLLGMMSHCSSSCCCH